MRAPGPKSSSACAARLEADVVRRLIIAALAAAALALPGASEPAAAQTPAQRDWTRTVVATPEGGFRMGNPEAQVKVVEYLSLTCPHCAEFAREGTPSLIANHVRSGRVSLEYRNFVLNPVDATATLLTRCATPENVFRIAERLFATQTQWVGRIETAISTQRAQINALPTAQRLLRVAELGGLTDIAAQHGVPAAQARACLADEANLGRLAEIYRAAEALGVQGTPTFLINGARVEANTWPALEALIRQAGG